MSEFPPVPPQPDESTWKFIDELRTMPVHSPVTWTPRPPADDEAHFPGGPRLQVEFPDPQGLLETAYADFGDFLRSVGLGGGHPREADTPSCGVSCQPFRHDGGPAAELATPCGAPVPAFASGFGGSTPQLGVGERPLVIRHAPTAVPEQHVIEVTPEGITLSAADADGIRRGLIFIEDEMLRRGGPFLALGKLTRTPQVRTRISRCFYGPINRPPKLRDELTDDVDYYPDAYLNRLAHEHVNVLWMTVNWYELIPSQIIPEYGRNAGPRLEKLRRTVDKCARYGIRIYPFCIEPCGFGRQSPEVQAAAKAHPELLGHNRAFCTSTEKGQAYIEEAVRTLFELVPGLGGMIVIPVGERQTHCYSSGIPGGGSWPTPNNCPRCSQREPYEVLRDTLAAMRRGMDQANPKAELVAWPYGQFIGWGIEKTVEAAGHIPPGVILQHNFETGGANKQLGKWRPTWDYWLSYVGPSEMFRRAAEAARKSGTRTSAKLQVGCSHEVATTQVVPAPGLLYRKYRAMRQLGVSGAMESWYFGTYPSLMTRAAGELSFNPFPRSSSEFLLALARRDWGEHAAAVAEAWEWFSKGYNNYPTAHIFGYFGPMHDGPAWPLYLVPRRLPLAPTWQIPYPPSGDYIADCVANGFTLDEMVTLCRRMTEDWDRGMALLEALKPALADQPERLRDIGLAQALGLQFRSGYHILRFYQLRERLAEAKSPALKQRLLGEMRGLLEAEIAVSEELLPLAEADSRLGFHSEAEGYKYHPALLGWRIGQLRTLLAEEFPQVEAQAARRGVLWPDYIGQQPQDRHYNAPRDWAEAPVAECTHWLRHVYNPERWRKCAYDPNDHLPVDEAERGNRPTTWQARWDDEGVHLRVVCRGQDPGSLQVFVEHSRTQPRRIFFIGADGSARCQQDDGYIPRERGLWQVATETGEGEWTAILTLPWEWLGQKPGRPHPIRVNVIRQLPINSAPGGAECSWMQRRPAQGRLVWGDLNPATDLGWLRFV